MPMLQIETATANGPALNWLVAKCQGEPVEPWGDSKIELLASLDYVNDWVLAGPIIAKEIHAFERIQTPRVSAIIQRRDHGQEGWIYGVGPTMIVAALRAYVIRKLGEMAWVPDELLLADEHRLTDQEGAALESLRSRGYAVIVLKPPRRSVTFMTGASARELQAACGGHAIDSINISKE